MNSSADALMGIFGMYPVSCKTCAHARQSSFHPMVYCPVKLKPVNAYYRCDAHKPKDKK